MGPRGFFVRIRCDRARPGSEDRLILEKLDESLPSFRYRTIREEDPLADGVVELQRGVSELDSLGVVDIRFTRVEFQQTIDGVGFEKIAVLEAAILCHSESRRGGMTDR